MKKTFTLSCVSLLAIGLQAQTITYGNFSTALTDTIPVNLANNSSFNPTLPTTTGTGVTWDASALTLMSGPPTIHLSFHAPSSTPQGSQYPLSNYAQFDPALPSMISVEYSSFVTDSVSVWGTYASDGTHEIFQNPDKRLVFPFVFGQTFTDNYAKTNYSDATTISSYQTGTRTVNYAGYGTLILPQGTFTNIALVKETRTNSLGPDSYVYTWYDISNGKKLLYRSENAGSTTTVWCADATVTGINEMNNNVSAVVYPNPVTSVSTLRFDNGLVLNQAVLTLYNNLGEEIKSITVTSNEVRINREGLPQGICFYRLHNNGQVVHTGKIMIQ